MNGKKCLLALCFMLIFAFLLLLNFNVGGSENGLDKDYFKIYDK